MSNIQPPKPARTYYLIGAFAVLHSVLLFVRATQSLPKGLPGWSLNDRFWICLALLWFVWLAAMLLHPRRSWLGFGVPIVLSLLFLVPSSRFYYWIVEEELNSLPSPKPGTPLVEATKDVGGGFRRVGLAEYVEGGFENVYHGEYLFYRERKLADWLSASVAPSRQFAVFIEPESGHLVLFRVSDQAIIKLSHEPVRDFGGFIWDETAGSVSLNFASGLPPLTFPLR